MCSNFIEIKLNYILNSGRRDTEPHFPRVFFQYLYFNVQGISIENQARNDYGNQSPKKDLIQDVGRILPNAESDI